ncbi:U7 snRNA-associated Sm-like protein Lsm11 [Mactra antiquata]
MAAPISSQSDSDENAEFSGVPDYLDWRASNFDPLRAIYDDRTPIPNVPGAKQFNNIAEFENFLEGKDSKSQKKKRQAQEPEPGMQTVRASAKEEEAARKAALTAKYGGPAERSSIHAKYTRVRNVLTRMEGFKKGPFSLMRRCVEERLRVIVVVRAAVAIRSRCRGYIVAFDKHFNMALMDVDEKMIKPVCRKRTTKCKMKKDNPDSKESDTLFKSTQRLSLDSSSMRSSRKDKSNIPHGSSEKLKLLDNSVPTNLESSNVSQKLQKSQDLAKRITDYEEHFRNCLSDSNVFTERQRKKLSAKKTSESDSETQDKSQDKKSDLTALSQRYQPFWPLYKTWTEMRCNSEFEIITRHVNQLFIRGENVVSVSICD